MLFFGWSLERTGNRTMPFDFSDGPLVFAIVMTYRVKPDRVTRALPADGS